MEVKSELVIVGAPPSLFGTANSRYQGSPEVAPPNAHIPNVSVATAIVSPSPPVAVLHAAAVAGGGQKPMFAKAEIEAARNTSSSVRLRVTFVSLFLLFLSNEPKLARLTAFGLRNP